MHLSRSPRPPKSASSNNTTSSNSNNNNHSPSPQATTNQSSSNSRRPLNFYRRFSSRTTATLRSRNWPLWPSIPPNSFSLIISQVELVGNWKKCATWAISVAPKPLLCNMAEVIKIQLLFWTSLATHPNTTISISITRHRRLLFLTRWFAKSYFHRWTSLKSSKISNRSA